MHVPNGINKLGPHNIQVKRKTCTGQFTGNPNKTSKTEDITTTSPLRLVLYNSNIAVEALQIFNSALLNLNRTN